MISGSINADRLLNRIGMLGEIGRDGEGRLVRLAASDTEKLGRDRFVAWLREAGLSVAVDRIGNIFGMWEPDGVTGDPVMLGSHIDTVIDAGVYDGCYGGFVFIDFSSTQLEKWIAPDQNSLKD
jgi:N-carbamoyl-L-amino-acid hydrolase